MTTRFVLVPRAIRALVLALCGFSGTASALTFAQTYFVPLTDADLQASWQAIGGSGATIGSNIKSVISIAVPKAGTHIYYDQWEDGYDADPSAPAAATTQIWGDGNTANGTAPGYSSDIVPAGGVIVLNNTVALPRVVTSYFYDGRDRVNATNTIAVARVGWPIDPGPVVGTSAEAYDTRKFGTSFQMPIGTLTGSYQQFEYTSIHILAAQDGTVVQVDTNADGTVDQTQTLDMGQTMFVNGGVTVGATVTSSKPVEVHEVTGDIGSNFESRTFAVRPTSQWSSGYFAPVTTTFATAPHVVYLYNPGTKAITVSYEGLSTTGTITVPSKGNASFNMPSNSAVHFFTVTGEAFYAVGANDAGSTAITSNQNQDWGYALMPDTSLTTSIIAPFAPGADDTAAPLGTPDANGSPIWVTPTATTTVYVNYSGDRATGPNTAPDGSKYDISYLVPKLGVQTIFNPTTFDMSKSVIFTTDSTGLAGGWGEDPSSSGLALPYLDLGYAIIPFSAPIYSKFAALSTDVNANGVIDQGDTVLFTLFLNNDGVTSLVNPSFIDAIPAGTTYVANSTVLNGAPVPDDGTGTAFPLDGTGVTPPDLAPGASATVKFRVSINSGAKKVTNIAQANSTSVSAPMQASVTFPISPVIITGNVYNDANGLTDGIVNGAATNAGGLIYANIVADGVVQQVYLVDANGTFRFINMPGNSNYTIQLSTTRGTVDAAPPAASLPAGYANTGENLGLGVSNDGSADGSLSFAVSTSNVVNANFGIERIPTANAATSASQVNPGSTTRVTVPTLSGTDPEDTSITNFIISTLPSNGTLYYNSVAVTAGQLISGYTASLLTMDPNDGAITVNFTYAAVDGAGKSSLPATVTMPFSSVSLSGIVYDDANGTVNSTVDGTGSNAGGRLYVNLITGGNVSQVQAVAADGTFNFLTVPAATYTIVLSTNQGIVGSPAPVAVLPAGYAYTAEKLGTGTGNDGTTDGSLAVTVGTTSVANARFGFNRLPTANNVTAASQTNPAGTVRVTVPTIGGTDPEDASIATIYLPALATNGRLYYNGTATTAAQTINNFNSALLAIDPTGNTATNVVSSFTYSVKDAAGMLSPVATVTMPFAGSGISIFGNVFNDANGLSDSIVNGAGTNGGGLFAILSSAGVVAQSSAVGSTGAYSFAAVSSNTSYTVTLSTTAGTVGSAPPAISLPAGYVATGEFIGTGTGNDGTVNASLAVAVTTTTVSNANFGIDRTPTASVLAATMANPGGTSQVTVPSLTGTDPEDGALSKFVINTLPGNGILYYNSIPVTLGQTITGFTPALLKLDPNDGAVTVSFNYSTVDAAGKTSTAVSCSITFTSISIAGNVFDDANGLVDNIVNGTGTNAGNSLFANLVNAGVVAQTTAVAANGVYSFGTVATNTTYKVVLSTTQGVIESAAPAALLPTAWINTGEFIGTVAGNDGAADGSLVVSTVTSSITSANFGIDALPTATPITAASQVNPAGNNQITVPTLSATDPEDVSITKFAIQSLPSNGTLYYNGVAVTVGQVITGYSSSLLKFDPVDGALTASFNYAAVDAAGKYSPSATVNMPFTTIGISGIVFVDANGQSDGTVNGTGTNAGNTLYASLVSGGNVVQTVDVQLAGTYNFLSVIGNTSYTVVISTSQGVVGSPAPAAALPAGYLNTGEFVGASAGSDGNTDGSLPVVVSTVSIVNANFGIEQPPSTSDVSAVSRLNPAGSARVAVPDLAGTDPEDLAITSFKITTLPSNGTLYYNETPVTLGQTINSYVPSLLTIDPADGVVTVTFTFSAVDAAGKTSSDSTATMPFAAIGLSGNVYNDANGLLGSPLNTVDGTVYAGATVYANLVSGGTVAQVAAVSSGSFSFDTIAPDTVYSVILSTTQGTVGGAAPTPLLPGGFANTGEYLGTGPGSDGSPDGTLAVSVSSSSVSNVNFGVERLPVVNHASAASQINPAGTIRVTVPTLNGADAEDGTITAFKIATLPINGTLYYNGNAVTLGQTITGYNATLLTLDPTDGPVTASFTYTATDTAGKISSPATVSMPFTAIGVSGNVFNDANGLTDSIVNGSAYSGATLYAHLIAGGNVAQVTTVASGVYNFGTVASNTSFTVLVSTTQGTVGSAAPLAALPAGYVNTGENIGTGAGSDGTANGSLAVAVVTASVSDANFGVRQNGTVTGHLYVDTNGNAIQDAAEPDLAEIDVVVTDVYGATRTATTDLYGNWTASLPPGSGTADVQESDPQFLSGYIRTQGTDTTGFTVIAGSDSNGGTNGYFLPGFITGTVVKDIDNDGDGDAPVAGVVIRLLDSSGMPVLDGAGAPVTFTTISNGSFAFENLPPGNYRLFEVQPAHHASVGDSDGANNNIIGDTAPIVVTAGNTASENEFIEIELGVISGIVSKDTGNTGSGDSPFAGVVLTLLDDSGNPVDGDSETSGVQLVQRTTDVNGEYFFEDLFPGLYQISEAQPSGYGSVSDADGGDLDKIGNITRITVAPGQTVNGRNFVDIQLGAISGFVTANGNALAGITIALLDASGSPVLNVAGEPITTVTGSDGSYIFTGVMPGSYKIRQVQPFGYNSFGDADGGDLDLIGDITPVSVLPGQTSSGNNFIESLDTCPDTWAEWKFQHSGETASGNPDNDAIDNLNEFAFAKPAGSGAGDAWSIRPSASNAGTLEAVFTRPKGAYENVTYSLEFSANLTMPITWSSVEIIPAMVTTTDNGDCTETVVIHDLETLTGFTGGTGFVRIRADLDEESNASIDHVSRTEVEGWKETGLALCCRTYNNPFLRDTVFNGTVGSVLGQTLDLAGSAGSIDLSTLFVSGVSYYAEVTSGENEGHRFDVVSSGASSITLAIDANLDSAAAPFNSITGSPPSNLAGDVIVIRRHWMLNEMFPPSGFGGTSNKMTADQVQLFAGGQWIIYWLFSDGTNPARWVKTGDNTYADQGASVVAPGQGVFFNNRTSTTSILAYGEVRANRFIRPIPLGSSLIAGGYPIDQSAVGTAGRAISTAAGLFGSRDVATADTFYIWDGDTTIGATGYSSYYLNNNAPRVPAVIKWVKVGDATLLSRDAETLLLGNRSVFFRSKNGLAGYSVASPWHP